MANFAEEFRRIRQQRDQNKEGSITLPSTVKQNTAVPVNNTAGSNSFAQEFRAIREQRNAQTAQPQKVTSFAPPDTSALDGYTQQMTAKKAEIDASAANIGGLAGRVQDAEQRTSQLADYAKATNNPAVYSVYYQTYADYEKLVGEYNAAIEANGVLVDEYNTIRGRAMEIWNTYETWRNSLRGEDIILSDVQSLDDQAADLRNQRAALEKQAQEYTELLTMRRGNPDQMVSWQTQLGNLNTQMQAIDQQINGLQQQRKLYNDELYWSRETKYTDLDQSADFANMSSVGGTKIEADSTGFWNPYGQGDIVYDFINDIDSLRKKVRARNVTGREEYGEYTKYAQMEESEIARYNYLYNTEGKDAADKYLEFLSDLLVRRQGEAVAATKDTTLEKLAYAPMAGLDRFKTGIEQLFSEEALPTSYVQYAGQKIRENMSGFGGGVYDFIQTMSNIAPSILLSTAAAALTGGLGAAPEVTKLASTALGTGAMVGSAAGNAYQQKVQEGYDPEAARNYAELVGASEGALQYALGGIGKLGGLGGKVAKAVAGIDSAFVRFALQYGGKMVAEGTEEALQEVLEPLFAVAALGEEYEGAKFEDIAYSFLLGAASAGVFEFSDTLSQVRAPKKTGQAFHALGDDAVNSLIEAGLAAEKGSTSYKIAQKLQQMQQSGKKISDYQLGRLVAEESEFASVAAADALNRQPKSKEDTTPAQSGVVLPTAEEYYGIRENTQPTAQTPVETPTQQTPDMQPTVEQPKPQETDNTAEDDDLPFYVSEETPAQSGVVLPTAEEYYGIRENTQPTAQTTVETPTEQNPGMLPTAEDADRNRRAANAKTELERSGILADATDEMISTAQHVSEVTGRQIAFYKEAARAGEGVVNGYYNPQTKTIMVNTASPKATQWILGHELTHTIETAGAYQKLRDLVFYQYRGDDLQKARNSINALYGKKGVSLTPTGVDQEIVANYVADHLFTDQQAIDAIVRDDRSLGRKILDFIDRLLKRFSGTARDRDFLVRARKYYAQALESTPESMPANVYDSSYANFDRQRSNLDDALAAGDITEEEYEAQTDLMEQDAAGKGIGLNQYSIGDAPKNDFQYSLSYDREFMDAADKFNDKNQLVPFSVMDAARDARQAVADIFNDPALADSLGLPPDIIGNTYIPNGSYSGTEENTTECIRSLAVDALMDAVAEHLGRPLTVEDTITISQEYWKYTDKPECLYCYVAMDRKAHREFLGSYLKQRDDAIRNIRAGMDRSDAYQIYLDGRKDTKQMRNRFNLWLKNMHGEMISSADLASRAAMEKAATRSTRIKEQVNDALKYAQSASWAKKRISYNAYNNHILKWKDARIVLLNTNYGLRLYSFSDFSPAFILENMQMITDAAVRGLKVLAYTKELDFVRIFADTGMNINISVFGYDDGNGGVAMDAMQGADWNEAQQLRQMYDNVGCTFVATNDQQIQWALDQDWIDVVIPFHMVRTGSKVAEHFGWKNYTAMSADVRNKDWTEADAKSILPPMHQNDKATYLQACEDNHLTPRFSAWQWHPNYMKLVSETRRSEGDTMPVQPIFNLDAAKDSIETMRKRGGYYTPIGGSKEVMQEIAEDIADTINKSNASVRYSISAAEDAEYMAAVDRGDMETAQKMVDEAAKAAGYKTVVYHGTGATFTRFNRGELGIHVGTLGQAEARNNTRVMKLFANLGESFEIYRDYGDWHGKNTADMMLETEEVEALARYDETKYSSIENKLKEISRMSDDPHTDTVLREYLQSLGWDSITYENRFEDADDAWTDGNWSHIVFDPEDVKSADPVTYDDAGNVIPLSERFNVDNNDIRYSISEQENAETTQQAAVAIPAKAEPHVKRVQRNLYKGLAEAFGVPKFADRKFLQDLITGLTNEYLQTGRVSQETLTNIFERGYESGIVVDREFYDNYKHIKDHLRTQPITISDYDAANIPDYNLWRKKAFGTLRIVNEGGLPVDSAYQELMEMAPILFPDTIVNPAEQLMQMYEVAKAIHISEQTLNEAYGYDAATYKQWARNDFDTAVSRVFNDLKNIKRYVDERNIKEKAVVLENIDEVKTAYKELKAARRIRDKVVAKTLLTKHDNMRVGKLLRGEIELEDLNPQKDNVNGITAVYEASKEYDRLAGIIARWKQQRKSELYKLVDQDLTTANSWHDKSAGILYSRETMERNIRDIIDDKDLAERIIQIYFAPVHKAAAAANRTKEAYRNRVRAMNLSTKVDEGNEVSEAYAVQLVGEAEDNIRMIQDSKGRMNVRDGKTEREWEDVLFDLWQNNPNLNREKIHNAVEEFRKIYDELFVQMNEVRVDNGYEPINYRHGYFPHFQKDSDDGILGLFGKALGVSTEVTALPTTINGLTHTFRPGIRWIAAAQERTGFRTAYDAVEGFDRYIEGVADVIHQTENIQRLRALSDRIRYRTGDEGLRRQIDEINDDPTLDEETKRSKIKEVYENGKYSLSNFVVELDEYTNLLANKKSRADRNMEQSIGRRGYNLVKALENRVAANMVAINPASWLTNFIALTQGNATLNRGELLRGMWRTLKAYKEDDGMVARSSFLTNRRGSDPLVRTTAQKWSATLSKPMEWIDSFTADSLVRARYDQNLQAGMSEQSAIDEADAWVAGVMADRSKGSMPTLFNRSNPLTKLFTQFQLEVNNQISYLTKDMPKEAGKALSWRFAKMLFKFALGAWMFNELYEYLIGRRPALDPIGILNDTVGDLTGYELPNVVDLGVGAITGDLPSFEVEEQGLYDAATNLGTSIAENIPFVGGLMGGGRLPISSALPDIANLAKAALNDKWDTKKRWTTAAKELVESGLYWFPPFGGGQIKKILEGIDAVARGGSYTVDSDGESVLQYPISGSNAWEYALNYAQAMTFGKTSLPGGREWIESGFDSLSANATAAYKGMIDVGVDGYEAYDLLQGLGEFTGAGRSSQQRDYLRDSAISEEGKAMAYYGMLASDKEKELMDELADIVDISNLATVLMAIKDAGDLKGAESSNGKREAIIGAAMTDDAKKLVYRYTFGTKNDNGTYATSREEDILAFEDAGMDFDTFLMAQNAYTEINEAFDSATEKATEFSRWVNDQGFTEEQAAVVRDSFKYYTQMPAEAGNYDKFVGAGLTDEDSYALSNALNALEPLPGKTSVAPVQKWRAVVDTISDSDDQMSALEAIMTDSAYEKLQVATSMRYGIDAETYVTAYELLPYYDENANGSYTGAEVAAALNHTKGKLTSNGIELPTYSGRLTTAQKAILWQLLTGNTSAKNNPFDVEIGWRVLKARGIEPKNKGGK